MWKRVGIELYLERHKLSHIETSNPGNNVMAAMDMLSTWNGINEKVSRRMLYETIKCCRTNKGISTFSY